VPHLSEIQKKYAGKVNVIGLNVWEDQKATDNSYFSKIDDYIKEMGDKMVYSVAADGFEGTMAKNWMQAAERNGIPTSFVVGKDGTVLWIGHPAVGLDKALDEIIAGKYDLAAAAEKDRVRRDKARAEREMFAPINTAMKAGDTKGAVAAIDSVVAKRPEMAGDLGVLKFNLLLKADESAAMAWAKTLSEGAGRDNVNVLNSLAWGIVDDKAKVKNPDYGLAVQIGERGISIAKETDPFYPFIADTYAYALYKNGQLDRALVVQAKAVAAAEAIKGFSEPTLKEIRDRLDMFKAKKAAGGGGGG
jgi:hypothetical protein